MALSAVVLYDFEAEDPSELTIHVDEWLEVVNETAGEGWCTVKNHFGQLGLVPTSYIDIVYDNTQQSNNQMSSNIVDPWNNSTSQTDYYQTSATAAIPAILADDDDDWDDSGDSDNQDTQFNKVQQINRHSFRGDPDATSTSLDSINEKVVIIRKHFSKTFMKSGGEDFVLGYESSTKRKTCEGLITDSSGIPEWYDDSQHSYHTCQISSSQKESKMKGIKSFISYKISSTFTKVQVSRRYKHFDWLHKRLVDKFICICIPPLPEKQVTGRYDEDFVETRRRQLQSWLNRLLMHPVVSKSAVLHGFLTCTDEGKKWKALKRDAEKDSFQFGKFFYAIDSNAQLLDNIATSQHVNKLDQFSTELNKANKTVANSFTQLNKQHQSFSKDCSGMAEGFAALSQALTFDPHCKNEALTQCLNQTGQTYQSLSALFSKQPSLDGEKFIDEHYVISGLTNNIPTLISLQRSANNTAIEVDRAFQQDKVKLDDRNTILSTTGLIAQSVQAESILLSKQRTEDIKRMMTAYLNEQINFFRNVTTQLEIAVQAYDSVNTSAQSYI